MFPPKAPLRKYKCKRAKPFFFRGGGREDLMSGGRLPFLSRRKGESTTTRQRAEARTQWGSPFCATAAAVLLLADVDPDTMTHPNVVTSRRRGGGKLKRGRGGAGR